MNNTKRTKPQIILTIIEFFRLKKMKGTMKVIATTSFVINVVNVNLVIDVVTNVLIADVVLQLKL